MKKFLILVILMFGICSMSYAQQGTLSAPVVLSVPTATKIDIRTMEIDSYNDVIRCTYRWVDDSGNPIYAVDNSGRQDLTWVCRNNLNTPVADCTGVGVPYHCCTGLGTGPTCVPKDMCYNAVAKFKIRTQDVDDSVMKLLRKRVLNRMKDDVPLLTGVTISFTDPD